MKSFKAKETATGGIIAALYILLTMLSSLFGLSSGMVQVRFSEMLTILPVFFPAAVPGLFVGCLLANLLTGAALWDVVFGAVATLLGAVGTRLLRKNRYLSCVPPILANTLIVPLVLIKVYGLSAAYPFLMLTVFIGEFISCGLLGQILYDVLRRTKIGKGTEE